MKPPVRNAVALPDFQPNLPSSAALLDRSLNDVYTPYVCNPSKALPVQCYVVVPVLLHWCHGVVAPWRCDIVALWRHADAVLVFLD
jgi:hypothetical protein